MIAFSCHRNSLRGFGFYSNSAKPGLKQIPIVGFLPTPKQVLLVDFFLALKPEFASGLAPTNLALVLLPVPIIGIGFALGNFSLTTIPSSQLIEISGPVIYFQAKLQRFSKIYIDAKNLPIISSTLL